MAWRWYRIIYEALSLLSARLFILATVLILTHCRLWWLDFVIPCRDLKFPANCCLLPYKRFCQVNLRKSFIDYGFGINHLTFFNKFSFTLAVGHRYDFVAYLFRQDSHHGNGCLIADKTSLCVIRPPTFKGNQRWVEPATGKNIAKSTDKSRQLAG